MCINTALCIPTVKICEYPTETLVARILTELWIIIRILPKCLRTVSCELRIISKTSAVVLNIPVNGCFMDTPKYIYVLINTCIFFFFFGGVLCLVVLFLILIVCLCIVCVLFVFVDLKKTFGCLFVGVFQWFIATKKVKRELYLINQNKTIYTFSIKI